MHRMSRTFSLGRLMVGVTVFCVLCGLAVNFPEVAMGCAGLGLFCAPTVIVCGVLGKYSIRPSSLWTLSLLGAFVGLLLVPGFGLTWRSGWQDYVQFFLRVQIPPALGALLFGGSGLMVELRLRRGE